MDTHLNSGRSNFGLGYVLSIKDKITVDLKCSKLEKGMADGPATIADIILISLDELYAETITRRAQVDGAEEVDGTEETRTDEYDDLRLQVAASKIKEKQYWVRVRFEKKIGREKGKHKNG